MNVSEEYLSRNLKTKLKGENLDFRSQYQLMGHLKQQNSKQVVTDFIVDHFTAGSFRAFEQKDRDYINYQHQKQEVVEGGFQCRKCRSTRTSNSGSVQLRSGDEASNYFVRCNDCGYEWKE